MAAITDYASLQAAVLDWSASKDAAVTAQITTFISLGEERINARLRSKKRQRIMSVAYAIGATSVTLPTDCIEVMNLLDTPTGGSASAIVVVGPTEYSNIVTNPQAWDSRTVYAVVTGLSLVFTAAKAAAGTVGGFYYAKEPALATNSTNDILTLYPSLYLYASLMELFIFQKDAAAADGYAALFAEAIDRANTQVAYSGRLYSAPDVTVR